VPKILTRSILISGSFLLTLFATGDLAHSSTKNNSTCYETEVAVATGQPGHHLCVGVTPNQTIHVFHWDMGSQELLHTKRENDLWNTSSFTNSLPVGDLAMALWQGDSPTVAYVNSSNGDAVWLDPLLGESSAELINPTGPTASRIAMAVDSGGQVKVIFYSEADAGLWYSERVAGVWSPTYRVGDADDLGAIALKPNGQPWIVVSNAPNLVVYNFNSVWSAEVVQINQAELGARPAITINPDGEVNVAWMTTGQSGVVYRNWLAPMGSTWNLETVSSYTEGLDAILSIHEEPLDKDMTVSYLRESDSNFRSYNRNSESSWSWRGAFLYGSYTEAATAPHPISGIVIAVVKTIPGGNQIDVSHQEVIPTILTPTFYPNPALPGEYVAIIAHAGCHEYSLFDGEISNWDSFWATSSATHVLSAVNPFGTTEVTIELEVLPKIGRAHV